MHHHVGAPVEGNSYEQNEQSLPNNLRDALRELDDSEVMANSCGLRGLIERQLLSNDVYDRVLGKSSTPDSPASVPDGTGYSAKARLW